MERKVIIKGVLVQTSFQRIDWIRKGGRLLRIEIIRMMDLEKIIRKARMLCRLINQNHNNYLMISLIKAEKLRHPCHSKILKIKHVLLMISCSQFMLVTSGNS